VAIQLLLDDLHLRLAPCRAQVQRASECCVHAPWGRPPAGWGLLRRGGGPRARGAV